jgi:catechol 2,3-dioxygenase-like lactoylglutathione lyase family enzyme
MLSKNKVVAFVPTIDSEAAKRFYVGVLGLRLVSDDPFALVVDGNGTTIRIAKVREYQPFPFTVLGWEVADIESVATALTKHGVAFERYGHFEQDKLGIWQAPGGARVAWFKDPDGNTLSLTQHPA